MTTLPEQRTPTQLPLDFSGERKVANPKARRKGPAPAPTVVWVEGQKCLRVELTHGRFALIDECDIAHSVYNWAIDYGVKTDYAIRRTWKHSFLMHRQLLGDSCNGFEVDHINGNGCDNRRCNLRLATRRQNAANIKKRAPKSGQKASSRFKGVTFRPRGKPWEARVGGCSLGCFNSEEEAAKAYDTKAKEVYGEFAYINFR